MLDWLWKMIVPPRFGIFGIDDVALAGIGLGGKLLKGFFGGRSEKKQAEQLNEDAEARQAARQGQWDAGQARRATRLNAVNQALRSVGRSLPGGAPDYTFSPETHAAMKAALPFAETVGDQRLALSGSGVDPSQGAGSRMLAGFASGLGEAADTAMLGGDMGGSVPANITPSTFDPAAVLGGTPMGGEASSVEGDIDWDEILRRRG